MLVDVQAGATLWVGSNEAHTVTVLDAASLQPLVSEARSGRVTVVDLERAALLGPFPLRPGIDGIAWVPNAT